MVLYRRWRHYLCLGRLYRAPEGVARMNKVQKELWRMAALYQDIARARMDALNAIERLCNHGLSADAMRSEIIRITCKCRADVDKARAALKQ